MLVFTSNLTFRFGFTCLPSSLPFLYFACPFAIIRSLARSLAGARYVPVKHKDTGRYELVLISELEGMKQSGLVVSERGIDVFAEAK